MFDEDDDPKILGRTFILSIRKSSRKWADADIRLLVTLLIDSHEALRRKAASATEEVAYHRSRNRRRRR